MIVYQVKPLGTKNKKTLTHNGKNCWRESWDDLKYASCCDVILGANKESS